MFGLTKDTEKTTQDENRATENQVAYIPAVDITENEQGYTIWADVPGANKESVEVTFEDNVVTLKANAIQQTPAKDSLRREFRLVNFERSFRVKDGIDAENIAAEIADGVLKVTLPLKAKVKKSVTISVK